MSGKHTRASSSLPRGAVLGGHLVGRQLLQVRDVALQLRQLGRRLCPARARLRRPRTRQA